MKCIVEQQKQPMPKDSGARERVGNSKAALQGGVATHNCEFHGIMSDVWDNYYSSSIYRKGEKKEELNSTE